MLPAYRALGAGEVLLLFLPLFTVGLGYGAVLPILPSLLERLHAAPADSALPLHAGLLSAIYIGAFVIAAPAWGRVTDRRGSRVVLLTGLLGYAAAIVWFGVTSSLLEAYAARFLAGAFAAGLLPATTALIVKRCQEPERARHLGWVTAATVAGFLVGPALSGWVHGLVADSRDTWASALHVTAVPIWTTGVIAIASAAGVAWAFTARRNEHVVIATTTERARSDVLAPRSILLLSALGAFGLGAFEVGLSLQSQRAWQWSPRELASLFVVCSLVMLIIQFVLFAPLQRRVPPHWLVIGGFVGMAAGFALLADTSTYFVVASLVAVIALGSGILLPTLSVASADVSGERVGTAIGYQNAAGNFGQAAGSAAAGFLFNSLPKFSFGLVAVLMLASALGALWRAGRKPG